MGRASGGMIYPTEGTSGSLRGSGYTGVFPNGNPTEVDYDKRQTLKVRSNRKSSTRLRRQADSTRHASPRAILQPQLVDQRRTASQPQRQRDQA